MFLFVLHRRWYHEYSPPPILMISVLWMIPVYVEANRSCRDCFPGVVTLSVSWISYYGLNISAYAEKLHFPTCHFCMKSVKDFDFDYLQLLEGLF